MQIFSTLALKVHFSAEFSSNSNQTHMNELTKATRKHRQLSLIKVVVKFWRKVYLEG